MLKFIVYIAYIALFFLKGYIIRQRYNLSLYRVYFVVIILFAIIQYTLYI